MSALSHKMLFRKGGTASSILAITLLVAIIASMNSVINHVNSQTEALVGLPKIGETYLILSENSNSIADSKIDTEFADQLNGIADIEYTIPQKIFTATLTASLGNHTVVIRAVEDVTSFLKLRKAYVNGTTAKNETEANIGEILARSISINLGDEANLTISNNIIKVKIVGTVRTLTQTDTELIVPMEAANHLTGNNDKISLIEFALKENVNREEAINRITGLLPKDMKVVKAQQPNAFMQDMNSQTLTFLNLWSLAVYAVVAAASYVVATRLIAESSYELTMLKALGAKKRLLFTLVLTYIAAVTLLGSILGVALGTTGTQTASTMLGWMWTSVEVNPFLEPSQAIQTLLLTLASSTLGCLFPAFSCARKSYMEQPI
jgi:ABC-type lipoprotein release transport system permease subunit